MLIRLFRNAGIYTLSNILSALVPFFCMPVLTRYLEPADYGIVAIMGSIISFMTPFVGVNIHGAIAANYYHDDVDFNCFVKSCLSILIFSSTIVCIIIWCFAGVIEKYTLFPGDWLWAVVTICFGQFLFNIQLTMLQIAQKAKAYGTAQILNVICNTGLSVGLVVIFSMNWQGRVLAQVTTSLIFALVSVVFLYRQGIYSISFHKEYIKKALVFGIPLIPHDIAGCMLTIIDRFYIANYVDMSTAGLFVLGAQIGMGMELLTSSFNKAYVPWLFEKLHNVNDKIKQQLVTYTYIYFGGILLIAGTYSLIMPYFLGFFVGEKFYAAGNFVWVFAFAGAFSGMYYMVVNYIFFVGETKSLMYRTFSISILHGFMSYYFTKNLGVVGAGYCVIISYLLNFLIVWHLSNRVYKMPWNILSIVKR